MSRKKIALSISVCSLKSYAAGIGAYYILSNLLKDKVELVAVAGASGGAIAAAHIALNHKKVLEDPFVIKQMIDAISKFKKKNILDQDLTQYILDRLPILGKFRKNSDFTGLLRGTALHKALEKLYNKKLMIDVDLPLLITTAAIDGVPPYDFQFVSQEVIKENKWNFVYEPTLRLSDLVRASSAIPCVFRPMDIGTRKFIDGGTLELVPDGSVSNFMHYADIECDCILSVSVLRSAYGKIDLPDPDDIFEVASNAAYAMNYSLTFDKQEEVLHPITQALVTGLKVKMTETKNVKQAVSDAIDQIIPYMDGILGEELNLKNDFLEMWG